jgi:hypothetical protein
MICLVPGGELMSLAEIRSEFLTRALHCRAHRLHCFLRCSFEERRSERSSNIQALRPRAGQALRALSSHLGSLTCPPKLVWMELQGKLNACMKRGPFLSQRAQSPRVAGIHPAHGTRRTAQGRNPSSMNHLILLGRGLAFRYNLGELP